MVGTLTAAQTQYFTQLSQQNNDSISKQYGGAAYQPPQNAYDTKSNVAPVSFFFYYSTTTYY